MNARTRWITIAAAVAMAGTMGTVAACLVAPPAQEGDQWPNATFGMASSSVNREGKAQKWEVAPDEELPSDFAPGDILYYAWNSEPQTLTPLVSRDYYATMVQREVQEPLIWNDLDTLKYVPGLARSWDVSDDGLTITFHIFEDAKFSDGVPVTSDDVVFTFDMMHNEQIDDPVDRSYIDENVESWKALDPHTVQFKMKKKYFKALEVCGTSFIMPRHIYGHYAANVYNDQIRDLCVGSGPWMLAPGAWQKGERLTLTRNDNYWGPKPSLDKIVVRFIQNDLTTWQEFKAGNIDLMAPSADQWVNQKDTDWMHQHSKTIEYYSPLGGYSYIGYNLRLKKFADKRVRQALTMLLDRQEIIDTLRQGLGQVVTGPFFFESDQYDKTVQPWPYDPERAKKLLADAGWKDTDGDGILDNDLDGSGKRVPFTITFLMPSGSDFGDRLQRYVKEKFESAGIKVTLDQLEWSVFEQRLTERKFEMVSLAWTSSAESDPYQIWDSAEAENRGSNYVGYNNPEVDKLIEAGRQEMDYNKRMDIWHKVHQIIHEDQPYTFLFNRPSLGFLNNRFENVKIHKVRLFFGEWYVPAAKQLRVN